MADQNSTVDKENTFLGRGWSFPPTFQKGINQVQMSEYEQDIQESLHILLSTEIGERVMRPEFGGNVQRLIFGLADLSLVTVIRREIEIAILNDEPRIDVQNIEATQNELEGRIDLFIEYTIVATNTRNNIVFPFYLIEGTDITS